MRCLGALAAALLLGGCTLLPPAGEEDGPAYRGEREALTTWTASGRILLRAGEESWHATLYWRQDGDAYRIRLIAPLGQGTVELAGGPAGVSLRTTEGETFTAADPDTLMLDTLGWRVPVAGLRHWMVGRAAPGTGIQRRRVDDDGLLRELSQAGWRIRYASYTTAAGLPLPRRLELETERFSVRVVVSRWEPGRA